MSRYLVEFHIGDDPIGLEYTVSTHTPEREVFSRELAAVYDRTPDEITVHSWYPESGKVEGGTYGSRWGSMFGN